MLTREIIFMMKTMKKISVPKMEVIRFTTEDVIVTSGTGSLMGSNYYPVTEGTTYFALGSEINDYSGTKERRENCFSTFYFDSSTGLFEIRNRDIYNKTGIKTAKNFDYPYAWYNDICWVTENKTKDYYIESGWTQ